MDATGNAAVVNVVIGFTAIRVPAFVVGGWWSFLSNEHVEYR
jgi:hypothetical protein